MADANPEATEEGRRIRKARDEHGMTQSELGQRLMPPTSWRTIAAYEKGTYRPKSPRREQLGLILGIDLGGSTGLERSELLSELLNIRSRVDMLIARL